MDRPALKLFVGNLNKKTSADVIGHIFEKIGPVFVFLDKDK